MSAWEHLNEVQFKHEQWSRESKGSTHRGLDVTAFHPKFGDIGRMALNPHPDDDGTHEILDMKVLFPRKGIGTGLYHYAKQAGLNPAHSSWRTDQGDAWARKVGGDLPPRAKGFS